MKAALLNYVESEGLARLTITILAVTCVGCLAYTWGYAEVRRWGTGWLERAALPSARALLFPTATASRLLQHADQGVMRAWMHLEHKTIQQLQFQQRARSPSWHPTHPICTPFLINRRAYTTHM